MESFPPRQQRQCAHLCISETLKAKRKKNCACRVAGWRSPGQLGWFRAFHACLRRHASKPKKKVKNKLISLVKLFWVQSRVEYLFSGQLPRCIRCGNPKFLGKFANGRPPSLAARQRLGWVAIEDWR